MAGGWNRARRLSISVPHVLWRVNFSLPITSNLRFDFVTCFVPEVAVTSQRPRRSESSGHPRGWSLASLDVVVSRCCWLSTFTGALVDTARTSGGRPGNLMAPVNPDHEKFEKLRMK
nr:hypothetical protein CFP56_21003 [Quercus suber]